MVHPLMKGKLWVKFHQKDFLFMSTRLFSLSPIVSLTFDCYNVHSIGSSSYHRQHICQVWSKSTEQFYLFFVQEGVSLLVNCDLDLNTEYLSLLKKMTAIMLLKHHSPHQQFKTTAYTVQSFNTKIIHIVLYTCSLSCNRDFLFA